MFRKITSIFFGLILTANSCFAAITFDGVDDYVYLVQNEDPDVLTISCWIKGVTGMSSGVAVGHRSEDTRLIQITAQSTTEVRFQLRSSGNILKTLADTAADLTQWTHIVGIFDNVNDVHYLYINGVEKATDTTDFGAETFTSTRLLVGSTKTTLVIAAPFNGEITEVAVWTTNLTLSEIRYLYSARMKHAPLQIQKTNLRLYFPINDLPSGTSADADTVRDLSGNGNNGTRYLVYQTPVLVV